MMFRLLDAAFKSYETRTLHEADFVILDRNNKTLGLERKTVADFLASTADKRLKTQIPRCLDVYDYTAVILEGRWDIDGTLITTPRRKLGWDARPFWGKLFSLQTDGRVIIEITPDMRGTVMMLEMLTRRALSRGW